ncbi:hypothetical protein CBZ_19280 [Cellulomonas biazotea]|uniref:Uncharacterized protein n=1 Tax=Cellulomonas biazotea TaxID=1709 RepID=A0A402DRW9_9CELL|nr:hypothetical protein CBZ_19280 [Cellulomonas biazotea]
MVFSALVTTGRRRTSLDHAGRRVDRGRTVDGVDRGRVVDGADRAAWGRVGSDGWGPGAPAGPDAQP